MIKGVKFGMGKYENLAKNIIQNIGGEQNIISLTNCITRLRFKLKDEEKADTNVLKEMDGVVTVVKSAGQYQVVIGTHVNDVRKDIDYLLGDKQDEESIETAKGNPFDRFVDIVSGTFQPIMFVMSAAGMLKGLGSILSFTLGSEFAASSTYAVLNAMGDGLFRFLPMFIGYTAMKKFGGSPFLGMMLASALLYTGFIDASIVEQFATSGGLNFFEIPFSLPSSGYANTVMPIIASTAFAAFIEKKLSKIIPTMVKDFLVPFFTIVISVPLMFILIGPVMNLASDFLGNAFTSLQTFSPILFGLILGFGWQVFVMFGLHWAFMPFVVIAFSQGDPTYLFAATSSVGFAQTGAVLAVMLKTKNAKLRELSIPAFISGIFGVTEPAIYGITLPKKKPFWASCIIGGLIGAIALAIGIEGYNWGGMGIFRYTTVIPPSGDLTNAIWSMILDAIALLLGCGLTFILGFDDDAPTIHLSKEKAKKEAISFRG